MKVFNHSKWAAIQRHREDRFQVLRNLSAERNEASANFGKAFGQVQSFQSAYSLRKVCEIVERDDRTLSVNQVEAKLKCLANEWPTLRGEFGLKEGTVSKDALVNLYRLMREKKRLQADYEKASEGCKSFGACFNVLNEFAAKYGKDNDTVFNAAPDTGYNVSDFYSHTIAV